MTTACRRRVEIINATCSIHVLIVDDNSHVREGIATILECEADMHVCAEACDGCEAVELFRLHCPDVTVMDLQMPRMDGVTAVKKIRAEFPGARILVLTTFDGEESI